MGGLHLPVRDQHVGQLERRVARGLSWTIVHTWGGQALSLIIFVILARLLSPADFGLVALAAIFVALAQLVVDQGLGDALVQRGEITDGHIDTAFWAASLTGALLTAVMLVTAQPISLLFGQPQLGPILQILSMTFVLSAFTSVPVALLTRELAFRLLAIRAIVSIAAGGVVGISMAVAGFGAWSLVGQQLAAATFSMVLLWRVTSWRPRLSVSRADFVELFSFGVRVVGSDILGFVSRNADNLLIGVFLGAVPLGIYAVGYRILDTSQRLLINVARKITFPVFSRLQHDAPRLQRAYLRVSRTGGLLIVPAYIGLALTAPETTTVLFGSTWANSGPVAALLFLSGPVLAVQAFSGSLLLATGHADVVFRFRLLTTLVNVAGFAIAVQFGILAVAATFTARSYLLLPLLLKWTARYGGVRIRSFLHLLRDTVAATAVMALAVLLIKFWLSTSLTVLGLLAVEVSTGIGTFLLASLVLQPGVVSEAWKVAVHAIPLIGMLRRSRMGPGAESRDILRDEASRW